MIWLAWRQHRTEIFIVGGVLALFAAVFIVTGRQMADAYQRLDIAACIADPTRQGCFDLIRAFEDQFGALAQAIGWLNLVPALLAMLVAAPLVARELELGTHRLIWTQSATRMRWLAVKLAVVLGLGLGVSAIMTVLLVWWRTPLDALEGHLSPDAFDLIGVVPLGYMLYAFALAITAGTLIRRTIPAMLLTLAGFVGVRLAVESWLRPNFMPPLTITSAPLADASSPGRYDWRLDDGWINAQGQHADFSQIANVCANPSANPGMSKVTVLQCVQDHGWLSYTVYQPAARFWIFQGIETALFVALALALLGLTIWWVRRRLS